MDNEYTKALVAISSGRLQDCILSIPDDIISMDLEKLEEETKPTEKQRLLKISVQNEIERSRITGESLVKQNMCKGVMHVNSFDQLIENTRLLAWLLIPNVNTEIKTKGIYESSLDKMSKIMEGLYKQWELSQDLEVAKEYHAMFKTIAARASPIVARQETRIQKIPHPDERISRDIEERIGQLERDLGKNTNK